jgi:hypothetical protein
LRYRHEFQNVAIEILKVNASSAVPIVEHCVIGRPRRTSEYEPGGFHSLEHITTIRKGTEGAGCHAIAANRRCDISRRGM